MRRSAFTLIELLIVVVIIAILAAVTIPLFTDATGDAKYGAAIANLRTLRNQIEAYKAQHNGQPPDSEWANLLRKTDVSGSPGNDFGPYLPALPINPFTNKSTVQVTSANPPTAASTASNRGWLYHAATGNVWLDQDGYLNR
jgi:general secretion pathway protein G